MMRSLKTAVLVALAAFTVGSLASADAAQPPNIVLIIGDDIGWMHAGFMGNTIVETPHLDELAANGVTFTHGFTTASVCLPSLRALSTGLTHDQWAAAEEDLERRRDRTFRGRGTVVEQYRTLGRELAKRGYKSWEGGKWWDGSARQGGFTDGMETVAQKLFSLAFEGAAFGRESLQPMFDFIDGIDDDSPFFIWFAPALPHGAFDAGPEFRDRYENRGFTNGAVGFFANTTRMDARIGELVQYLDDNGLREDTLLIYIGDNGWEQEPFEPWNHVLGGRKGKGSMHDIGLRTPIVFNRPGYVPTGEVYDDLVGAEDLFPTILEFAGAEQVANRLGHSLHDRVHGQGSAQRDHLIRYAGAARITLKEFEDDVYSYRDATWHYIYYSAIGVEELYAINDDPFENNNVAAAHPDLLDQFRPQVLQYLEDSLIAPERLNVTGLLTDEDTGEPIPFATISLNGVTEASGRMGLRVLTGNDGRFAFRNLPHADYRLRAKQAARKLHFDLQRAGKVDITLPVGPVGQYLPVTAKRRNIETPDLAHRLVGRVTSTNSEPIPWVTVTVRSVAPKRNRRLKVLTDENGDYRVDHLPAGRYRVDVRVPRSRTKKQIIDIGDTFEARQDLVAKAR